MIHTVNSKVQSGWRIVRSVKTAADGTAPGVTALTSIGTLSPSLTDFTYRCLIPETANSVVVSFTTNADANTATVNLYWRRRDGDWELLWVGDLVGGTQTTSRLYSGTDAGYYADTMTETTDMAIGGVSLVDNGGANRISKLYFTTCGYSEIAVWYTAMSDDTTWTCIMAEY
jgi:hypothetical protein